MTIPGFGDFYKAVHGRVPFPWQERLTARVLEGTWPAIDIPTGCGKTSVIDIAVYALAVQAELPPGDRSPLRIFFIVDRRLVVDDVFAHARRLAAAIQEGSAEPLRWARQRLLTFGGECPLQAAIMRGGMYRSNTWADRPNQPLVCVSTVDQAGSRLLFRGYGVTDSSRPIHAALTGNDSLLIVDEAHLSQPFVQTLESVRRYQGEEWRAVLSAPGLRFVEMSATRRRDRSESHTLTEADYTCDALRPRLERTKMAQLAEVTKLPETAGTEAMKLAQDGVIGIVLNTVSSARSAFEELRRKGHDCILLTGRIRPFDRDRLIEKHLDRMKVGGKRAAGQRLFVVATQTIEVGADLDFDGLVTEAKPIDSLRQRFGRLNRVGRLESARAAILMPKRSRDKDSIYGESVERTWNWLVRLSCESGIDFGVRVMGEMFDAAGSAEQLPTKLNAPVLFPAHIDAWAQTSPRPAVDPDIAPFLHGRDDDTADVQIVWRGDLDDVMSADPRDWVRLLEAAPPVSTEALPVPFFAARRWLQGRSASVTDIEGVGSPDELDDNTKGRLFLIWRGPELSLADLDALRPGDTVVVRSTEGGCDEFGWNPGSDAPVRDIGDLCANERVRTSGGRFRIRIHRGVIAGREEEVRAAIELVEMGEPISADLQTILKEAAGAKTWGRVRAYGGQGLLVESPWVQREKQALEMPLEEDEAEDGDAPSLTAEVTLNAHTAAVVAMAGEFAERCQLDGSSSAITSAAMFHDLGKQDERFQAILSLRATGEPLAKGAFISMPEYRRRRDLAGFPRGARHEFASVQLAQEAREWPVGCDEDLALYLIGTHHGYGRPFPPIWDDHGNSITAEFGGRRLIVQDAHRIGQLGSGWADRYAALTKKYGWWGIAFLEAILRRADCVVSSHERKRNERH